MIQQPNDRLPRGQLVRPFEAIVRGVKRGDGCCSCDARSEWIGGTACREDKQGREQKTGPATSYDHIDNRSSGWLD